MHTFDPLCVFSRDLPGVNPTTLNGMIFYYQLMTKWSGLGDSTELSRMGLSQKLATLIAIPGCRIGRGQPGSANQRSFCRKTLPFSKNHDRGPWMFTYEPLTFRENIFIVHDFTYAPLNFRENMFAFHNFPKKTLNFVIIHPKTPLFMNFYV
jgi:hypothetical protein